MKIDEKHSPLSNRVNVKIQIPNRESLSSKTLDTLVHFSHLFCIEGPRFTAGARTWLNVSTESIRVPTFLEHGGKR